MPSPTPVVKSKGDNSSSLQLARNRTTESPSEWTFNRTLSNMIRQGPVLFLKILSEILKWLKWAVTLYLLIQPKSIKSCLFLIQEEHPEVFRSRERHFYPERNAEAWRCHPLCFWPPEHHECLWEPVPSSSHVLSYEEPAPQALRHRGELWNTAQQ